MDGLSPSGSSRDRRAGRAAGPPDDCDDCPYVSGGGSSVCMWDAFRSSLGDGIAPRST